MKNDDARKNEYIFSLIILILLVSCLIFLLKTYDERKAAIKNKTVFILKFKEKQNRVSYS